MKKPLDAAFLLFIRLVFSECCPQVMHLFRYLANHRN
jgi:hypothetical protein